MYQKDLYVAILLPLLLMYLLISFRLLERRKQSEEERQNSGIVPVRDALLVTLALDLSVLAQEFGPGAQSERLTIALVFAGYLFVVHAGLLFMSTRLIRPDSRLGQFAKNKGLARASSRRALESYFALMVLMTNAATFVPLTNRLGGVL